MIFGVTRGVNTDRAGDSILRVTAVPSSCTRKLPPHDQPTSPTRRSPLALSPPRLPFFLPASQERPSWRTACRASSSPNSRSRPRRRPSPVSDRYIRYPPRSMPFTSKCPCANCTTSWPVRKMCPSHLIATDLARCKYLYQRADPATVDIRGNFTLLERAVAQFDTRFTLRALRSISALRKKLTDRVLCSVIILTYSPNNATARTFIEYIGMDGEAIQSVVSQYKEEVQINKNSTKEPLPEVDVYIAILIQVRLAASGACRRLTTAGVSV
jgi:hypothetical protein